MLEVREPRRNSVVEGDELPSPYSLLLSRWKFQGSELGNPKIARCEGCVETLQLPALQRCEGLQVPLRLQHLDQGRDASSFIWVDGTDTPPKEMG